MKVQENPSSGSRVVPRRQTDKQTDTQTDGQPESQTERQDETGCRFSQICEGS